MLCAAAFAVLLSLSPGADDDAALHCAAPPVEPCFPHRGRLSSQNGIALRLCLIATKWVLAV
jgi:hypothetical protein